MAARDSLHIMVCTHQDAYIYGSEILRPIIVGAQNLGAKAQSLQENLESKLARSCLTGGFSVMIQGRISAC